ncbi:UPF0147 family protein [Candidatus Woesearchaeota archaeon]|nr:UPF0147 family protein [Candidatus Woesearchaeota archaeon]
MDEQVTEIIEFIGELTDDGNVPRNVKTKLKEISNELKKTTDDNKSLTVNKLLADLDDIAGDANLDSFTRQQLWSITSMLEGI